MTPAAFGYGFTCAAVLALLPHVQGPKATFAVDHAGALLLGKDPVQGLLWGLAAGGVLCAVGQAFTQWTAWGRKLQRLLQHIVGPLHPLDALLLAALSSFAEELLFRGLLLPYTGLALSSLLFGLAHLIPRRGLWPWSLWAAVAGCAMGWLALASGGLLAPILAHFVVNSVGLLLLSQDPP